VDRWPKTPIACGVIPMALGTAVFIAWLFTDDDALELIGLAVIFGGVVLVVAGIVSLCFFVSRARRDGRSYRTPTAVALATLAANFPLCGVYVAFAFTTESAHLVTVDNQAGQPVTALVVTDPTGRQFQLDSVAPRQVAHACLGFSGEGAVEFAFNIGGETRSGILIGYLADPIGLQATLHVSESLTVEASERFHRIALAEFLELCVFAQ